MSKRISVIVPCYNVSEYLDRCYESLKNQTIGFEFLDCIFVNDASTDGGKTLKKLYEIEAESPENVRIVNLEENVGLGEARNIALTYAAAPYVQFLDADDELRSDACEILYRILTEKDVDIIQFNHLYVQGNERRSSLSSRENKLISIDENRVEERYGLLDTSTVTYGCTNKIYKRELIEKTGVRFPKKLKYEEPLFVYPLFLYAQKVYLLNDDLYIYYFRPGSIVTSELGKKVLDHPRVQLMLLEFLIHRPEFEKYKVVIEIYFLWSFYCETLMFAAKYEGAELSAEFMELMQETCLKFFPDWEDNVYVKSMNKEDRSIIESLRRKFWTQEELDMFLSEVAKLC